MKCEYFLIFSLASALFVNTCAANFNYLFLYFLECLFGCEIARSSVAAVNHTLFVIH